jgi:hypothetical protein
LPIRSQGRGAAEDLALGVHVEDCPERLASPYQDPGQRRTQDADDAADDEAGGDAVKVGGDVGRRLDQGRVAGRFQRLAQDLEEPGHAQPDPHFLELVEEPLRVGQVCDRPPGGPTATTEMRADAVTPVREPRPTEASLIPAADADWPRGWPRRRWLSRPSWRGRRR